ncbi:expressed unknown protein [Seminavis robusta]|uniref:Uncharacterized protein n=1 Tax=Seminavis robusta TaxID=568900 RepID=A0A9N8F3K2_9STRA|nr:expressed unknown protein [Seminavis robusta]|eukprot:Sro2735_g335910.1 n/a (103) ;mRNA; r:9864-10172
MTTALLETPVQLDTTLNDDGLADPSSPAVIPETMTTALLETPVQLDTTLNDDGLGIPLALQIPVFMITVPRQVAASPVKMQRKMPFRSLPIQMSRTSMILRA